MITIRSNSYSLLVNRKESYQGREAVSCPIVHKLEYSDDDILSPRPLLHTVKGAAKTVISMSSKSSSNDVSVYIYIIIYIIIYNYIYIIYNIYNYIYTLLE